MGGLDGKQRKSKSLLVLYWMIGIITVLVSLTECMIIVTHSFQDTTLQKQRIRYSSAIQYAEEKKYDKVDAAHYYVVGLDGKVLYSNMERYPVGRKINLHTLSSSSNGGYGEDSIFSVPLLDDGKQFGTIIFVDKKTRKISKGVIITEIIPLLTMTFVVLLCLFLCYKQVDKEIYHPISNLIKDIDVIINGNYQNPIRYNKQKNVCGVLTQKVEMLRDELFNYIKQVEVLHKNEKILLACVSHDLKTPISTIMGSAEMIRDNNSLNREGILHYVNIILGKTELLIKLINDILKQANAEFVPVALEKEEIYSEQFVEMVKKEMDEDIRHTGLMIEWGEVSNVLLNIDVHKIMQVFQNIFENSIKYTQSGGKITVTFALEDEWLAVEITDNGQGIAAVDIPFIFERFYRGEKARTQRDKTGSGLGLSIVKSILKQHGSKVECDSILGEGTTIYFQLPLA